MLRTTEAIRQNPELAKLRFRAHNAWKGRACSLITTKGFYGGEENTTCTVGFKVSSGDAPYVFLATNDPKVMRRGERADIAPTILERLGLDLGKIQPPLDGHPLTESYTERLW